MSIEGLELSALSLLNEQRWLLLPLFVQAAAFWFLLFRNILLGRQVRCLHFCYCRISDWAIDKVKEIREYYVAESGEEHTPFILLDAEKEWDLQLVSDKDLLRRAGVTVPKDNNFNYIMEDLTS